MRTPLYASGQTTLPSGIPYDNIAKAIEDYVFAHKSHIAAMEVAVFTGEETLYEKAFGLADIERKISADFDTVLEWGSVSKLLVWVSCLQLWEQGQLDLSADIRTYLPEGFLDDLTYDAPITMIHLMNHNAGFEDVIANLFLSPGTPFLSLEESLRATKPAQAFEPGIITGYSNWGCALAGFIVERISQKPFHAYVHEHIFKPLQMTHTALAADLSDNVIVQEKRHQLKGYSTDRVEIPNGESWIPLYPAGMATGTLRDLTTFGKALLNDASPLFDNPETRRALFSTTNTFAGTHIPVNAHGFWHILAYKVPLYGHGGNTKTNTAHLLLDIASGTGAAVMTNQGQETVFTQDMMEVFFGAFDESPYFADVQELKPGWFESGRTIRTGPYRIASAMIGPLDPSYRRTYWTYDDAQGMGLVSAAYFDWMALSLPKIVLRLSLIGSMVLGGIYAIATLTSGLIFSPLLRRRAMKRGIAVKDHPFRKWNYAVCGLIGLTLVNLILYVLNLSAFAYTESYRWQLVLFAAILLADIAGIVTLVISYKKIEDTKREKAKYLLTGFFLIGTVAAICYWQLYQFWAMP